uniref:Uncharacterized protein n=1 Tax=Parastrongyloides trichosuri TaxID=131310 RepID=A0A0N4Z708_PARTI
MVKVILLVSILTITNCASFKKPNIQDEVGDLDMLKPLNDATSDDYDNFNVKPLENRDAKLLKTVKYSTIMSTMATRPTIRTTTPIPIVSRDQKIIPGGRIINTQNIINQVRSLPRAGKYYEHYPYNKLPNRYQLRPDLYYVYPREFQNVVYRYPYEKLPYSLLTWYQQQQVANNAYNQYYGAYNQQYQGQTGGRGSYYQPREIIREKTEEPKFNDHFEKEDFEKLAAEANEEKMEEKMSSTTTSSKDDFFEEEEKKSKKQH